MHCTKQHYSCSMAVGSPYFPSASNAWVMFDAFSISYEQGFEHRACACARQASHAAQAASLRGSIVVLSAHSSSLP